MDGDKEYTKEWARAKGMLPPEPRHMNRAEIITEWCVPIALWAAAIGAVTFLGLALRMLWRSIERCT
jgi:hypothetical protein